jgi:3'-5' exonuclease
MSRCVFDIETAPLGDDEIPEAFVEKLREANAEDEESWRDKLGLYSLSASAITIAMVNPDTQRGEVIYDNRHGDLDTLEVPDGYEVTLFGGTESEMLERFWSLVSVYDQVISYNGRNFDVPFLMQRSLVREVAVSTNLMPYRYRLNGKHLDLADVLSWFRATRPYGLASWTQAIGATSPKEGSVAGAEVGAAFAEGRDREIAEYCLRDVIATAMLADRVRHFWGPMLR